MIPAILSLLWLAAGFAGVIGTILHKDGHLTARNLLQAVSLAPLGPGTLCLMLAHVVERHPARCLDRITLDLRKERP